LDNVSPAATGVKAIVVPHAGYSYSGPSAAYGYKCINPDTVKRIILLGPSHHFYTAKSCLSPLSEYETPLGNVPLDRETIAELESTHQFQGLTVHEEEEEHSLEMHLPYIAKIMGKRDYKLVPIMVGSVSKESEEKYGKLLSPYLDDPATIFVVSSDFCHWGSRFQFTPYDETKGPIYKSIEAMDSEGIQNIESGDPESFGKYLKQTKNTICGRHPISILLWALQYNKQKYTIQGVHYAQSSKCTSAKDSSVSYASIIVREL